MTPYALVVCLAVALQPGSDKPPLMDRFGVAKSDWPDKYYLASNYPCRLAGGIWREQGKAHQAYGFEAVYLPGKGIPLEYDPHGNGGAMGCHANYPPLTPGDVVPAFGRLYRVAPFAAKPKRTDLVNFEWVGKDFAGGKVGLGAGSFAVPLGAEAIGKLRRHVLWLTAVEPGDAKTGGPVGTLYVNGYRDAGVMTGPVARVRAGDVLTLVRDWNWERPKDGPPPGHPAVEWFGFRVAAVVPKDAATGAIGWVELDPEPLTREAVKARGLEGRVVEAKVPPGKK